jgi:hypothetical protein
MNACVMLNLNDFYNEIFNYGEEGKKFQKEC